MAILWNTGPNPCIHFVQLLRSGALQGVEKVGMREPSLLKLYDSQMTYIRSKWPSALEFCHDFFEFHFEYTIAQVLSVIRSLPGEKVGGSFWPV